MSVRDLRLCTGTTLAVFQAEGWTSCSKHSENRRARGVAKTALHTFRTLAGTPSGPVALAGSSWPRRRLTVDGRKRIRQSVEEHREGNRGISVALKSPSSRRHFLAKKRPKHSAISSDVSNSLPWSSRMTGMPPWRPTPPAFLTEDHHSLLCNEPLESRLRMRAVSWAFAWLRQVIESDEAVLYASWLALSWFFLHLFHAVCFARTAAVHSGVHHEGSEGLVISFLEGMNCCIPSSILFVRPSQAFAGQLSRILCQGASAILCCRYGPHEKSWKIGLGPLDLKSRPSHHCWVRRNSRESTNFHFGPVEGGFPGQRTTTKAPSLHTNCNWLRPQGLKLRPQGLKAFLPNFST